MEKLQSGSGKYQWFLGEHRLKIIEEKLNSIYFAKQKKTDTGREIKLCRRACSGKI